MSSIESNLRVAVWGTGDVARALADGIAAHPGLVLSAVGPRALPGHGPSRVLTNDDALVALEADCVVLTPACGLTDSEAEQLACRLLGAGKNVVSLLPTVSRENLLAACQAGGTALHATSLFPHLMLDRLALVLGRALQSVERVRVVHSVDAAALPAELLAELPPTGLGQSDRAALLEERAQRFATALPGILTSITGRAGGAVRATCQLDVVEAQEDVERGSLRVPKGGFLAVRSVHQAFVDDVLRLTCEEHWYLGAERASRGEGLPFGNFRGPYAFTVQLEGDPGRFDTQVELEPLPAGRHPLLQALLASVFAAIPAVCQAEPGIVLRTSTPRYQLDERLPKPMVAPSGPRRLRTRKRIVIWGPGEIGGAVTRAAQTRPDVEIVGAKVFSPHKHGRDLGELVGMGPLGVRATLSAEEILALAPDCVVMAPQPRAILEGLDDDVVRLLEAGINVITSAAYHNVSMPNWLVSAQTPTALLREAAVTTGMARDRLEQAVFAGNARLMPLLEGGTLGRVVPPMLDKLLAPILARRMPLRATPERLIEACRKGNASLHGTGVHPTFMAERVGMSLAGLVDEVRHVRFIEAADFSFTPDGMWGGLGMLGFGRPAAELDARFQIARAGDFYYGDVIGNAAHLLYGVPSREVRVERAFRALPAERDFRVGSMLIRKGHAAALHMVHKGFIGGHHFFTNEECWYLGPEREYRGDDLPFGNFGTPLSYTIDVTGTSQAARMQLSMDGTGRAAELMRLADTGTADQRCALGQRMRKEGVTNPITNATAMAILDAITPVCDMPAGVIIDDSRPSFASHVTW